MLWHTSTATSTSAGVSFNKNDFELSNPQVMPTRFGIERLYAYTQTSSCHGPAGGRGASGGDRRRGVGRAHPAGHAPQLGAAGNNREISTPQDVRNSVMALFWPVWGLYWEVYWELHWGLYWREGAAGGELFFGRVRGKEIARRKEITDALKREQTHRYFRAQSSSQTN
jgi:hypothetical protein